MNTFTTLFVIVMFIAVFLVLATIIISTLKNMQKSRFQSWTFLDYLSVGHARHLYTKYILRK